MSSKRTSRAFVASIVVHLFFVLIAGFYFITQTRTFQEILGIEMFVPPVPPKPQVRKPIVKTDPKPVMPLENTFAVETVEVYPRLWDPFRRLDDDIPPSVLEVSDKVVSVAVPINPNVSKVVREHAPTPEITTHADLPMSTARHALAVAGPAVNVSAAGSTKIGRGVAKSPVQVKITFQRLPGLSMVEHVGVASASKNLESVAGKTFLGNIEIQPPPKGVPCGRVIGRGRDIRGYLRFARIQHNLSDWWADSSSLNALTKWLNEKTKIRTDMNVEGGAVKLTDANLLKTPIAFMTGHDPAFTRSRNLLGKQYGGGKMDNRLTEAEAVGLRKYLVEKGGFLVFDDCGVNAPAQAMVRLFLAQMRYVMPEYQIERIDNKHEIYNNFYEMGGPPVGFDIFWWGTRPPKRNYLEGFSVEDKLSVIIVRRDYMCAMEATSLPSRSVHYSPGVYRFMTNVVVYALTHGAISDYSRYVPEDTSANKELPTHAPQAAKIGATE